jgi:hypothetical protein
VAAAQEGHHHALDQAFLAHDDLADLVHGRLHLERLLAYGLVELGDVDVHLGHRLLGLGRKGFEL